MGYGKSLAKKVPDRLERLRYKDVYLWCDGDLVDWWEEQKFWLIDYDSLSAEVKLHMKPVTNMNLMHLRLPGF